MVNRSHRVAIVFPADPERRRKTRLEDSRFARIAAALADKGIDVEGAPYIDDAIEELRAQLMSVDGGSPIPSNGRSAVFPLESDSGSPWLAPFAASRRSCFSTSPLHHSTNNRPDASKT